MSKNEEKILTIEQQALERIHNLSMSLISPIPVVESLRKIVGCEVTADKLEKHIRGLVPLLRDAQAAVHKALDIPSAKG